VASRVIALTLIATVTASPVSRIRAYGDVALQARSLMSSNSIQMI
jgi:hypothetical protein